MANFDKVLLINTPYRPSSGSFSKAKKFKDNRYEINRWYDCRDLFQSHLYKSKLFFFAHEVGEGKHVASFIEKIEELLEISTRSEFGPTQRKTILWISPSKWWTVKPMSRSLFTVLLRAGRHYNKDNFESVIENELYLKNTRYAFDRFLAGNTTYTGKRRGWYRQFYEDKPSIEEIDRLLVKNL